MHNIDFNCPVIMIIVCTKHGGISAVLCAKCQNDFLLRDKLRTDDIWRDLSLRRVLGGITSVPSDAVVKTTPGMLPRMWLILHVL